MRKKIRNTLKITCNDLDLKTLGNLEFYVKQPDFFGCYTPAVLGAHEMVVTIPFDDAKRLRSGKVELQFAFVYENGTPDASDIVETTVEDLLKERGYDPV